MALVGRVHADEVRTTHWSEVHGSESCVDGVAVMVIYRIIRQQVDGWASSCVLLLSYMMRKAPDQIGGM